MNATAPFRIETVDYATRLDDLRRVRETVFVQEQQVPLELEWDALDPLSHHVVAYDDAGRPIGTGRLTPEHRIGRMAVLTEWRGRGVGEALLLALLQQARDAGWTEVSLHAQVSAEAFYACHGFVPEGERFIEAGIEHQGMRRALRGATAISRRDAAIAITAAIVGQARRGLVIYSRELDPGLLDAPAVLEALRRFATSSDGAQVQILLQDAASPQRALTPLLPLAQRLPSVFAFREVQDPVDLPYASAYLANDAGGYYFRPLGHHYDGEAELDNPGRARQLRDSFIQVWERSRPCSELRALGL
ncbi:GNAT family N-acetyltransferase [Pseudoxanthomonas kalamensis DSM 18571]|uniref:GNAT family N-acetyltransferase n=1 Tax=Pseudoxanthomonas kalamensis TaxID=289483 RepID=UPI00139115DC|nr:GNAT family N-acetyltransferase [Pseudoxanthomonas kalamensis]KAF1710553.1 GNAT family N-acetyltransferase [Pseudoxanthomonas kalamensis DSM 18571]